MKALDDVSFSVASGSIHGLVGENGAGKSTIIKILSGIYQPDDGKVLIDGKELSFSSVREAQNHGIATIFQELTTIPELTVYENVLLGREPVNRLGVLNRKEMREKVSSILAKIGAVFSEDESLARLSIANQQVVEICKALILHSKIIIMDEPTSSLTEKEVNSLFSLIRHLKEDGITVLYVSHKLEEVFDICDEITVFRDGQHVGTVEKTKTSPSEIIKMMVGRTMDTMYPNRTARPGGVVLSVKNLHRKGEFSGISFDLKEGEILGFAGLIGAGRTEMAKALFGAASADSGEILYHGRPMQLSSHPSVSIGNGIAYLSEDRKREGIISMLTVRENMSLSILKKISYRFFVRAAEEKRIVNDFIERFRTKVTSGEQIIESLSGGNQQKVIISRLLLTGADVFIFDEPTRGIDVGAKYEIYKIMNELTNEGKSIMFISSELPELLGVSDRLLCMRDGRIVKEYYDARRATPDQVMHALVGGGSSVPEE